MLLHELAHTITPCMKEMSAKARGRHGKSGTTPTARHKDWVWAPPHTSHFYANYATLLRAAEALRIFTLPSVPNK